MADLSVIFVISTAEAELECRPVCLVHFTKEQQPGGLG